MQIFIKLLCFTMKQTNGLFHAYFNKYSLHFVTHCQNILAILLLSYQTQKFKKIYYYTHKVIKQIYVEVFSIKTTKIYKQVHSH